MRITKIIAEVREALERKERTANADVLYEKRTEWARQLLEVFGEEAAASRLVQEYSAWAISRYGHKEGVRRNKHLVAVISDPSMKPADRVSQLLIEIGGEFEDGDYLQRLDHYIENWRKIKSLEEDD